MIPKKLVPGLTPDGHRFPACAKPWHRPLVRLNASAGEGRSEKIMLHQGKRSFRPVGSDRARARIGREQGAAALAGDADRGRQPVGDHGARADHRDIGSALALAPVPDRRCGGSARCLESRAVAAETRQAPCPRARPCGRCRRRDLPSRMPRRQGRPSGWRPSVRNSPRSTTALSKPSLRSRSATASVM